MSTTTFPTNILQWATIHPLTIVFALITLNLLTNKLRPTLRSIPGPPLAAYTKLWRWWDVRRGHAHVTAIDLHKRYGKLVRIAPNVISVGDAAMIPVIYSIKGDFTKTAFYPIQSISWGKKPQMNLFSTRSETEHREQKKKIANAYTLESLLRMEGRVDDCSRLFLGRMGGFADKGEEVDLGAWLQYYAFDVVGELTFAKKLGFLEKGADVDNMMAAIDGMLIYASQCGQIPEAHPFLLGNPLFPLLIPAMETWNQVVTFTLKAINSRTTITRDGELELEQGSAGNDMLSKWAAVKSADPLKMSTRDAIVHLSANVFAGSDTTAIALRAILYFLIKNPDKMRILVEEIDEVDAEGKLSDPISDKEARNELPYLNAVIKEALRLHPSVGLLLERHVPAGGAVICGKHIPGGTIVGINSWVIHRDEKIFPDPERFEPERWLKGLDKDRLAEMEKAWFPFGAGSRTCTGRNISMIEMRKVVPQLLREFEVEIVGDKEWEVRNVWFVQQKMPPCRLRRRARSGKRD
ncbi:pisatin demethylase-like protein 4 [Elsinoe australis]|uniref:Pisatin demethylase-like protein 4 n=1 Tax=Elsinoe australis TaxID=40998 RepID=A0A4U7ASV6_9PEZI|nr:pisatin demethylase-like protein 4 [Elsinoe australis]